MRKHSLIFTIIYDVNAIWNDRRSRIQALFIYELLFVTKFGEYNFIYLQFYTPCNAKNIFEETRYVYI